MKLPLFHAMEAFDQPLESFCAFKPQAL